MGFPGGSDGKESACSAGDVGSIPASGRLPREGNSNPLQYSCPENSMDRGAWWATVHGVAESDTTEPQTLLLWPKHATLGVLMKFWKLLHQLQGAGPSHSSQIPSSNAGIEPLFVFSLSVCHLPPGRVRLLMDHLVVRVVVETSAGQVELQLTPSVDIPTAWSKKAQWPSCLKRWPSPETVQCIKVSSCRDLAHQRRSQLNHPRHHSPPSSFGRITEISLDPQNLQGHLGTCYKCRFLGPTLAHAEETREAGPSSLCSHEASRWFWGRLKSENTAREKVGTAFPVNCPRARGWPGGSLGVPTRAVLPAHCQGPHPRGLLRRWLSPGPAPPFSLPAVSVSLPVTRVQLAGLLTLSLAAELLAGGAGAAAAAGWGRGLPAEVLSGPAADEGGRLVSGDAACDHVLPPAGAGWPQQRAGRVGLCSVCVPVRVEVRFPLLPLPFCLAFSVSLSPPLFHSTNPPKCPLCARNPAEVQKWITACILYPWEVVCSLVRSCEGLRPQVDSHFPSCYHAFSLHSSPGAATRVPARARTHTRRHTHTHTLRRGGNQEILGLPHEHGSKPELPGCRSPGKDFFFFLIIYFLLLHVGFSSSGELGLFSLQWLLLLRSRGSRARAQ